MKTSRHTQTPLAVLWGDRLRRFRLEAGLTQLELAEAIGASQWTISRLETGAHRPSDPVKIALAQFFETAVEAMFPYPAGLAS